MRRLARRRQDGIALLEAMLAIVILGIGLLGTVGLQARAYSALSDASMRAEAAIAGEKLVGMMTADLTNIGSYQLAADGQPNEQMKPWVAETVKHIPGAQLKVEALQLDRRMQVNVTIRWQRKAGQDSSVHQMTFYVAN
jgi:type IV pilus assembly protein PilV